MYYYITSQEINPFFQESLFVPVFLVRPGNICCFEVGGISQRYSSSGAYRVVRIGNVYRLAALADRPVMRILCLPRCSSSTLQPQNGLIQ